MGACGLGPQSCPRIPLKGGEAPGERGFCILCLVSRTTRGTSVPLEMGAKTRGQLAFGALSPELMGSGVGAGVHSRAGRGSITDASSSTIQEVLILQSWYHYHWLSDPDTY